MSQGFPVTIAELLASGGTPLQAEAVAITLDVCSKLSRIARREVPPPISAGSVFIDGDGTVSVAGGAIVEDDQTVSLVGHLLLEMLRPRRGSPQRPAARLEALAIRAAAGADVSGLNVERFAGALRPFSPEDRAGAIRALFQRWRRGDAPPAGVTPSVPETIRRLLPEADLAAMAGLTPWFRGGREDGPTVAPARRMLLTVLTLLLLGAAGATYLLQQGNAKAEEAARPAREIAAARSPQGRELLPVVTSGSTAAAPATSRERGNGSSVARPAPRPGRGDSE